VRAFPVWDEVQGANRGQDRMPIPLMDQLNDAQRQAAQDIINGPRKALHGPFIPLLRSPENGSLFNKERVE